MYKYRHREYKAGNTIEIIETFPGNSGRHLTREHYRKGTSASMARYNTKMQERKLTRLINHNFKPDDWFITLHYNIHKRPTPQEAKQQLSTFLRKLRRLYSKYGAELKYIKVTAYGSKGGIHHHIVINNIGLDTRLISALWNFSDRKPDYTPLYANSEYSALAIYLIKQSRIGNGEELNGRYYSGSHNLVQPPLKADKYIERIAWKEPPMARKGYYIDRDTIDAGINERTGRPYLFYRMIKIPPNSPPHVRITAQEWKEIAQFGRIIDKRNGKIVG